MSYLRPVRPKKVRTPPQAGESKHGPCCTVPSLTLLLKHTPAPGDLHSAPQDHGRRSEGRVHQHRDRSSRLLPARLASARVCCYCIRHGSVAKLRRQGNAEGVVECDGVLAYMRQVAASREEFGMSEADKNSLNTPRLMALLLVGRDRRQA